MPHRVYIGIGSNLGDRRANTLEAIDRITQLPGTRLLRASSLYESEPLGDAKTWFVNSAIEIETEFPADQLLKKLKAIEETMGRKRVKGKRWGSRIIDLDILLADQEIVDKRTLKVPHPEMHKRRFVLMPLAELAPHVIHPQLGAERLGPARDGEGRQAGDAAAATRLTGHESLSWRTTFLDAR